VYIAGNNTYSGGTQFVSDVGASSGSAFGTGAITVASSTPKITNTTAGTRGTAYDGTFTLAKDAQTLTFRESTGRVIVVPEPGTTLLGVLGVLAALASRRGRRR